MINGISKVKIFHFLRPRNFFNLIFRIFIDCSNFLEFKIINLVSGAHALSLVPHVFFLIILITCTHIENSNDDDDNDEKYDLTIILPI